MEDRPFEDDCREESRKAVYAGMRNGDLLKTSMITGLGVVIGAHCGPGLLTVFYLCGGRNPE